MGGVGWRVDGWLGGGGWRGVDGGLGGGGWREGIVSLI